MNVLIICTEKLPVPPVRGGAIQTYIAGAVPTLRKHHKITLLGRTDPTLPNEEVIDGIQYIRIPGGLLETYRNGVVEFLKASPSFDLIHIFNRPRLVRAVREAAPNSRIILSMHNDMFKPEKIDVEEATLAIEQVDKIITISDYIGKAITELYPEAEPKLRTIYSGVDLNRFVPVYSEKARSMRQTIRKEHGLESKKVILFAGRLSPNKGVDVLVRAMPELAKKHSNVALVIMGGKWFSDDGITDYIAYVRALAQRSVVPIITTGFVAPDKIQEWFAAADVFVCPSQWQEPLARVHYEAMAAGLPIVTTNRGGNTEVIEPHKNGIIVENPSDRQEFVQHISYLLSKPQLCREMGQYGRKMAEENFNWIRVVNDILSVWNEIEYNIKNNIEIGGGSVVTDDSKVDLEKIENNVINEMPEEVETEESKQYEKTKPTRKENLKLKVKQKRTKEMKQKEEVEDLVPVQEEKSQVSEEQSSGEKYEEVISDVVSDEFKKVSKAANRTKRRKPILYRRAAEDLEIEIFIKISDVSSKSN